MPKTVYVESTIPSYLVARPSRDLLQYARQKITQEWWSGHRHEFELRISQIVVDECSAGDHDAASRRLEAINGIALLDLNADVASVAAAIMKSGLLPEQAARDAVHLSVSSVHGLDILITWNCKHIANATILRDLEEIVSVAGFQLPVVCTPEELIGD